MSTTDRADTCKQSFGQGNIFTGVYLSTRGVSVQGGFPDRDPWQRPSRQRAPQDTALDRDSPGQRPPVQRPHLYGKERAVRILLECILVFKNEPWIWCVVYKWILFLTTCRLMNMSKLEFLHNRWQGNNRWFVKYSMDRWQYFTDFSSHPWKIASLGEFRHSVDMATIGCKLSQNRNYYSFR